MNGSIKIRMRRTVWPDVLFLAKPGTVLRYGKTYEATANDFGAVCGICENGEKLGVVPGEFEFIELPQWLADIWNKEEPWCINGAKINVEEKEMNQEREGRILEAAVTKYGSGPQTDMMIEEMSELTKALCKYRRAIVSNAHETEISARLSNVLEEMADVQIMLNQMVLIYDHDNHFNEWEIMKLERLAERCGVAEDG